MADKLHPIAVVGLGGVFPGAPTLEEFWDLISAGRDASREVPPRRWALPPEEVFQPWPPAPDRVYTRRGYFIESFRLDLTETESMPDWITAEFLAKLDLSGHYLLHAGHQAWKSCVTAGLDRHRVGVIVGNIALPTEMATALAMDVLEPTFLETVSGPAVHYRPRGDVATINRWVTGLPAGILASSLGLGGGSYSLDAACASSLYALKLAVDELQSGRAQAMLAGGLCRPDSLYTQMGFSQLQALSRTGRCRPFNARADGLVVGEGAGVLVLKRLDEAVAAGDHIWGVIRGIGLSNDLEGNLLAPSREGQLRAMRTAYAQAGWEPCQVDLIEGHATGTPLGDRVELESLRHLWGETQDSPPPGHEAHNSWLQRSFPDFGSSTYGEYACGPKSVQLRVSPMISAPHARSGGGFGDTAIPTQKVVLGSVKANIGHLLTGAGAASLIKVLLAMRRQTLPPVANLDRPLPEFDRPDSPFAVLKTARPWARRPAGEPRRAAVSGFGFGGTNAHVLVEEWLDINPSGSSHVTIASPRPASLSVTVSPSPDPSEPLAIVGMAAAFGPWAHLPAFADRVLGSSDHASEEFLTNRGWWGVEKSRWFEQLGPGKTRWPGYYIDRIKVPIGRFRIPPKEIQDMLPQQAHMLQIAAQALADAGYQPEHGLDTGVFIGLGLDLNTTNYHFRWRMSQLAKSWAQGQGLNPDTKDLALIIDSWRQAAGPSLTADRTLGALASIVASRIAREFRIGGPSYTVSGEEASGLLALNIGLRALQKHEVRQTLIGAVDFVGDVRTLWYTDRERPWDATNKSRPFDRSSSGPRPGEGAAALVLKRLSDALADGNRIYAVIRGLGIASGAAGPGMSPGETAYELALIRAYQDAGVDPASIGLLETHGSGHPEEDRLEAVALSRFFSNPPINNRYYLGSTKADIGHTGAVAGLASVVKAALCLYDRLLPPLGRLKELRPEFSAHFMAPKERQYWLHNQADGARRAGVSAISRDGNCAHVVLEEYREEAKAWPDGHVHTLTTPTGPEALFLLAANNQASLRAELRELQALAAEASSLPWSSLAKRWWGHASGRLDQPRRLALLAAHHDELMALIDRANQVLESSSSPAGPADRLFYESEGLGHTGQIALVFPGSGNHFPGMGRDLSGNWPQVFRGLDRENDFLAGQFGREAFWYQDDALDLTDHRALIMAQVAVGVAVNDIITGLGVKPDAVLGYSLGESAALFATRSWTARDEMLRRVMASTLFTHDLAGECRAARRAWGWSEAELVDWVTGVVNRPVGQVREALTGLPHVYLLIVNTPNECLIGGQRQSVRQLLARLSGVFVPVPGVTTVHCEVVQEVAKEYRDLHLFPVIPTDGDGSAWPGVRLYSAAWGRAYLPTTKAAADSILAQALSTMDFPGLVEQAYADGVRLFLEMGPGASCTRMISQILAGRPHLACAAYVAGQDSQAGILKTIGRVFAHGGRVDLTSLYGQANTSFEVKAPAGPVIEIPTGRGELIVPAMAVSTIPEPAPPIKKDVFPGPPAPDRITAPQVRSNMASLPIHAETIVELTQGLVTAQEAIAQAHSEYLSLSQQISQTLMDNWQFQMTLLQYPMTEFVPVQTPTMAESAPPTNATRVFLDRDQCLEFARGTIGRVLGSKFAEIDTFPTRVRLPDEPLMLVDRIVSVTGEPLSLGPGRVTTEHDVTNDRWYLDNGHIPAGVAIESGQADLFLSAYLGVDFQTRGLAVYRLLDAEVTFHDRLPAPGQTINYDIRLEHFFRHGQTYLFRFNFTATVAGQPLMTMKNGCAGFFTPHELAAGKGLVQADLEKKSTPGHRSSDWVDLVPIVTESLDDDRTTALYAGNLGKAFGPAFAALPLTDPLTLPTGRLQLIHRVLRLDPQGGRYGLGLIKTEMDIHPDDWFLTCHFVDDMVMPGTLMYECCLHSLRIFLMRLGWVGEKSRVSWHPLACVSSKLKCRGQVTTNTRKVAYEIFIKELGYYPDPYAMADGIMYADGRPIVDIENMTLRLSGLTREELEVLWAKPEVKTAAAPSVTYGRERILALAVGNPSEALGERYRRFDHGRFVARLPGPPYSFMDSITPGPETSLFEFKAGGTAVATYTPPPDAWYFTDARGPMPLNLPPNRGQGAEILGETRSWTDFGPQAYSPYVEKPTGQCPEPVLKGHPRRELIAAQFGRAIGSGTFPPGNERCSRELRASLPESCASVMPLSVLLEVALQPCGFMAAYCGAALTSNGDLHFRNLGGTAVQRAQVTPETGPLTTRVKMTRLSTAGGMIILNFDFQVHSPAGPVYHGQTYFGFFSPESLARQRGITEAKLYVPDPLEAGRAKAAPFPKEKPFPQGWLRMIDRIDALTIDGGPHGRGYARGHKKVDPGEWFFQAHFYQDPVWPGSLGLEAFLQVLQVQAAARWPLTETDLFQTALDREHEWVYRGQVVPTNREVMVESRITAVNQTARLLTADGFLTVDGTIIYQMKNFGLLVKSTTGD